MSLFNLFSSFFKKKVGLALSGGAARGLAHIGVLKVLKKHKIPIDCIAGASIGAVIGAIFSAGMDPDIMEINAQRLDWFRFLKFPFSFKGILSTDEIEKFIIKNVGDKKFSELNLPLSIVACDLRSEKEVVINEGKVAHAAAASSAFPGIFTAVDEDGQFLVDGGIINNLPTNVVKKMGADFVIAVDVVPRKPMKKDPQNQFQMLGRSYDVMVRNLSEKSRKMADVVISPDIPEDIWHFDISEAKRLIKAGEDAAKRKIPEIKAKLVLK